LLLQVIGQLQFGCVAEENSQGAPFFGVQIGRFIAQGPHAALQLLVLDSWELLSQPFQFLFAQIIQAISVTSGDMETIDHDPCLAQLFSHGFGKTFVHVTTHRMHALLQALWDRAQKVHHAILLAVWQDCQNDQPPIRQPCRHYRYKVAVTFLERNFIQPRHSQSLILPPLQVGADPTLQHPPRRNHTKPLL
jgi:hypothetical protein